MIVDKKIVQNDPPQEKIKFILKLINFIKLIDAIIEKVSISAFKFQ